MITSLQAKACLNFRMTGNIILSADLASRSPLVPWRLRRVTDFIIEHLAERIGMEALAEVAGVSRRHFMRGFMLATGLSPHQWHIQARITEAKRLMRETDEELTHIALEVGFADLGHLGRAFKRIVGETPKRWRLSQRALN